MADNVLHFLPVLTIVFTANLFKPVANESVGGNLLDQCRNVRCRAGRECRVLSTGSAECICRSHCPSRQHPVCGSDGILYENHCELHRQACLGGHHITPEKSGFGNGSNTTSSSSCINNPWAKFKRQLQKDIEDMRQRENMEIKVPRACHQNERDRTREMLISWVQLVGKKFIQGIDNKDLLSVADLMKKHFHAIDTDSGNSNGFVDMDEWLKYFYDHRSIHSNTKSRRRLTHLEKLRKLCFEALIEEGDRDQDWRLNEAEFATLLDPNYEPSRKYCKKEKKKYEDGTKIKVDCNGCTCSCGKWICTSKLCQEEHFSDSDLLTNDEKDFYDYDDMDNVI